MKWRDLKNLTPEERKEMRRAVAKTTSETLLYLKKIKEKIVNIEEQENREENEVEE